MRRNRILEKTDIADILVILFDKYRIYILKMVKRYKVQGYENFLKFMEDFKSDGPVFVLYSGTKLDTGVSWCPDCVEAEPFIEEALKLASENSSFILTEVGDRATWKDLNCSFRKDSKTKLKVLPTLAKWGTQKRLEGDDLLKVEIIEMLLTDEDD